MTKEEIVRTLAEQKAVEEMCKNVAHLSTLTPDLQDLAQGVYLILLEYDEEKLVDLWEHNALGFFIARIIANQYLSKNSPFYKLFRKFRSICDELNPEAYDEEGGALPAAEKRVTPADVPFLTVHRRR